MNTRTPEPARPPEPSRRPRGAFPCQDRPAPPPPDGGASLSPDPASPAAAALLGSSLPRRSFLRRRLRSLGRHARAAALALACLAALALAGAGAARADVLVSNIEQTFSANESAGQVAQSFTTGNNTAGYRLTSVEVKLGSPRPGSSGNGIQVRIAPELTGNLPDLSNAASIITLSNPATVSASSDNTFNAPANTTLGADTTYYVVVTSANGEDHTEYRYHRTDSDAEDTDSASGWSIGDTRVWRSSSSNSWNSNSAVLLIRVNGTVVTGTTNTAPTGAPTITGTAQVDQTLTAVTTGILDANGLTSPTYTYQWIRVDSGTDSDISGANSSTYTLAAADEGKTIKVRVTFDDDDGHTETLTSAATAVVAAAAAATCAEPNFGDRRNFWSGTLTVRPLIDPVERIIGHGHQLGGTLLPNNRFSLGSVVDFKILEIYATTDGDLKFNLNKSLTDETHGPRSGCTSATWATTSALAPPAHRTEYQWSGSLDWSGYRTRTVYLSLPANNEATGAAAIFGTAIVGETLTAAWWLNIADTDGLPGSFTYTYQWYRVDADGTSNEEEISGVTVFTYTLTDDDIGKRIKVKLSFTDQLNGKETRTSAATAVVAHGQQRPGVQPGQCAGQQCPTVVREVQAKFSRR